MIDCLDPSASTPAAANPSPFRLSHKSSHTSSHTLSHTSSPHTLSHASIDGLLDCLGPDPSASPNPSQQGGKLVDHRLVTIVVVDRGCGIPMNVQEHLFVPFANIRAGDAQQDRGSGLGLCLAKEIVMHHGGDTLINTHINPHVLSTHLVHSFTAPSQPTLSTIPLLIDDFAVHCFNMPSSLRCCSCCCCRCGCGCCCCCCCCGGGLGDIVMKSEVNKGSTFGFAIPLAIVEVRTLQHSLIFSLSHTHAILSYHSCSLNPLPPSQHISSDAPYYMHPFIHPPLHTHEPFISHSHNKHSMHARVLIPP